MSNNIFKIKINGLKKKVRFVEPTEILAEGDLLVHREYADRKYITTLSKLSNVCIIIAWCGIAVTLVH